MLKVVVVGQGEMLMNLIAGALDAKCEVVGVLRYETVKGQTFVQKLKEFFNPSVDYNYIKSYKLNDIKVKSANSEEFRNHILKLNADIILVGTWCEKLEKSLINMPKVATINAHPSLLPKYRGPNPYLQVIKHKETKSGITFHLMDENYDTGPILLQKTVEILPTDTSKELKSKTVLAARGAVCALLENLKEELIIPIVQSEANASYFKQVSSDEIMLDFSKPAEDVAAHIRAFYPFSKTYFSHFKSFFVPNPYCLTVLEDKGSEVEYGKIVEKSAKNCSITVVCGDGKLLKMDKLNLYGKLKSYFTVLYIKYLMVVGDKVY